MHMSAKQASGTPVEVHARVTQKLPAHEVHSSRDPDFDSYCIQVAASAYSSATVCPEGI